jgi:ferric-dicitrate binding protein FerR (iron transport regulator)
MSDRPSAEEALRNWQREPVPVEDADAGEARRRQVVARMAGTIREAAVRRERTRRRWRVGSAFAVAAVMLLGVAGVWRASAGSPAQPASVIAPVHPAVQRMVAEVAAAAASRPLPRLVELAGRTTVARRGSTLEASAGDELRETDQMATDAEARATVALASGASVAAAGATSLSVREGVDGSLAAERIHLGRGVIEVRVPKLGAQRALLVLAPDAEVVVHGTVFEVRVRELDSGGTETSVSVSEGKVSVRHRHGETALSAGHAWSSGAPQQVSSLDVNRAPERAPPAARAPAQTAAAVAAVEASKLAEQNRLFQAAMAHKRAGDDRRAVGTLDELLSKHPGAPLAQEARVERMRALQRLGDRAGAARDARRYLAEHGDGFAREEAKEVAVPPTASPGPSKP